ncbi:hypothetical protein BXZ70DRAFT_1040234 [Cristinia sonorae]|uniref:Uncharacterized protein n=1 Tax=Cristinia sonorae TaxID=1940300 RepID=A0A8K0XLZ3_9AGAR|nr:hypothetical protein BXZ70DRAFT_1040234 [Cristinia sonorae]
MEVDEEERVEPWNREGDGREHEGDNEELDDDDSEDEDGGDPPRYGWEPPVASGQNAPLQEDEDSDTSSRSPSPDPHDVSSQATRVRVEEALRSEITVVTYPSARAGAPISESADNQQAIDRDAHWQSQHPANTTYSELLGEGSQQNIYAPFDHEVDWLVARWAKLRGPGSNAFSELLDIPGVQERLGLSYGTSEQLNKIIDQKIPNERPRFQRAEVVIDNIAHEVYFRDVLECISSLYGDPDFASHLVYLPERHYADADQTIRLYHDIYTGKWWWVTQDILEKRKPGATIIPVLVSSDKTQVTSFGGKTAYPIYLTIGNLPKEIRRKPSQNGQILLGYLPTTKLDHISNKARRRRVTANVFHACVREILKPLERAGEDGVPMTSGDGVTRRTHPIFAAYIGDYPEQVLVTGIKTMQCPTCEVPCGHLGDYDDKYPFRDLNAVLNILALADESPGDFLKACREEGIKPIYQPFWLGLPLADPFLSITPDILHQLYQGVIKHLVAWLIQAFGAAEIDARCAVTGQEHADIARILMGLIVDLPLPGNRSPAPLVRAVRAILDFLYLAQYPVHSTGTLDRLDDALKRFHDNKAIFLHWLDHYRHAIERLGTTDNFNTEYTERLHIDMAKDAYDATNGKDVYSQMTIWLERKEKMLRHGRFVEWRKQGQPQAITLNRLETAPMVSPNMTKNPSARVDMEHLAECYGAVDFQYALAEFILTNRSSVLFLPFVKVPVYHKARFWDSDFRLFRNNWKDHDVLHVKPARITRRGKEHAARFDTAVVNTGHGDMIGVDGYEIAQVRVIFSLPKESDGLFKPDKPPPPYLAYVEWFTGLRQGPHDDHGMFRLTRKVNRTTGKRAASVVSLSTIRRSVMLFPRFGAVAPRDWTSENVLDLCSKFYVNAWTDRHLYGTFF